MVHFEVTGDRDLPEWWNWFTSHRRRPSVTSLVRRFEIYSSFIVFHGCWPADASSYYASGLQPSNLDNLDAVARTIFLSAEASFGISAISDASKIGSGGPGFAMARSLATAGNRVKEKSVRKYLTANTSPVVTVTLLQMTIDSRHPRRIRLRHTRRGHPVRRSVNRRDLNSIS